MALRRAVASSVVSRAVAPAVRRAALADPPRRGYNFASSQYHSAFGNLDTPTPEKYSADALEYLSNFNPQTWFDQPIHTVLNGRAIKDGKTVATTDAFGKENGKIILASDKTVDEILNHMKTYVPPAKDYRDVIRSVEKVLLTKHVGLLIGNQAVDFGKQDGITEIVEAVEANTVERRFNDQLLADEEAGLITVPRTPHITGCVSNFSNFLDLCRKTLRCLEVGVPVVVFSRSNTTQHMFRWFEVLNQELAERGFPAGMLTYASIDVAAQRKIMAALPDVPMNLTSSREIAALIKEVNPRLCASTGGPNMMIATELATSVATAMRISAQIENAGQCTALRCVVSPAEEPQILAAFDGQRVVEDPTSSLRAGAFDDVFARMPFTLEAGYTKHPTAVAAVRTSTALPPADIDEHWRNVYVDATTRSSEEIASDAFAAEVGAWLVDHQPISCAVNGRTREEAYAIVRNIFERSSLIVYSCGSVEKPCLTAQARPQVAEIFGEVPPRNEMDKYTRFPVVGPSSTPSYFAAYTPAALAAAAARPLPAAARSLEGAVAELPTDDAGYVHLVAEYIQDAAVGARPGADASARTALYGLQRPPIGMKVVLRVGPASSRGLAVAAATPFVMTNAADALVISAEDEATAAWARRAFPAVPVHVAKEAAAVTAETVGGKIWQTISADEPHEKLIVGPFVTRAVALGHIKSVFANDDRFVAALAPSPKWLRVNDAH